jgi:hypothetical protein
MPLEKTLIPIDLSGSLDTKTDQKMVLPSKLTELENGVFTKGSTITKRNGYSKLSRSVSGSATSISSGDALGIFQDELLLFSDSILYSYVNGRSEWVNKGGTLSVNVTSEDIIRNNYEQSSPDIAYGGGLYCIVWEDTQGGVRASVTDATSGAVLQNNTLISATGKIPRVIELDQRLAIVYVETSDNDIDIKLLDQSDPTTFGSASQLASNSATSGQQLDATVYQDNAGIFAYRNDSSQVQIGYITQTGAIGSSTNGFVAPTTIANDPEDSLTVYRDSVNGGVYVGYSKNSDSSGLKVTRLREDLTTIATYTVEATGTAIPRVTMQRDSEGDVVILYEHNATNDYDHLVKKATYDVSASSIGSASVLKRSVGLASKGFYYNSKTYMVVVHASDLQSTFFLMDSTGLVVAKMQTSVAGGLPADSTLVSVTDDASTGIFKFPVQVKTRLVSRDDDIYSLKGLGLSTVDFTQSASFQGLELGENLHIAGGFVSAYDSQNVEEYGFHLYPENVSAALASGGSLTSGGSYQFRVIYIYTDARGQIHRSAPSVAVTGSPTGSNLKVTLTIPTLRITEHTSVNCEVYRTQNNGTVYYKVGSVANDTSANSVSFTDDGAINDTQLLAKELLYTNGGIVENISPPATSVLGNFNNRMFAVSSENPKLLYYSKKRVAKSPVEFSDVFSIVMNKAERVTALVEMDEKFFIFEPSRIFYITGDGPTPAGLQNNFSEPQLITSDVGCTTLDSVILTPLGIMFMSQKGIYLLDRKMETAYIGAGVESYNSETITSAVMVADNSQVRFTTQSGPALVYDFYYGKWSTFTNHSGTGAVIWKATDNYTYLRTSGGMVYQEDSSSYTDVDASVSLKLTTAWIKPSSVQGLQRVRRALVLGDYKSNHVLQARVAYNFEQFYNEKHTFDFRIATGQNEYGDESPYGSEYYGAGTNRLSSGAYQFSMHLARQKVNSVRFELSDTVSSDPGESYSIANLMLEVGLMNTPVSLPQQKMV